MTDYEVKFVQLRLEVTADIWQACYVFTPDEPNSLSERPPKRSKIGRVAQPAGQDDFTPFVPLLRGLEKPENIIDRYKTYEYLWRPREEHINVNHVNF